MKNKKNNKAEKKQTISACLVIHNEEKFIKRCIESFKDIADEIIIVHSGKCTDNTLKICRKYTNKIYIAPDYGVADPNRTLSFSKAKKDWILRIDGDEYLSKELRKEIPSLIQDPGVDGYACKWDFFNYKNKHLYEYKLCLARRKKMLPYEGKIHEPIRVNGIVKNVDFELIHTPPKSSYTWESFKTKGKWAKLQAERNEKKSNVLVYLLKMLFVPLFYFVYKFLKYFNLRVAFFSAMYSFHLYWHLILIKLGFEK